MSEQCSIAEVAFSAGTNECSFSVWTGFLLEHLIYSIFINSKYINNYINSQKNPKEISV